MRFSDLTIRQRLVERSVENRATPVVNGVHCREWTRACHHLGYGKMWDGERARYTHRLSFAVFVGQIPVGLSVLHRCDNPKCIEPRHLWAGTKKENSEDMVSKGRHLAGRVRGAAKCRGRPAPHLQGSKHVKAKLSEALVLEFRGLLKSKKRLNVAALARQYGVSSSLLYGVRDGRNWNWSWL